MTLVRFQMCIDGQWLDAQSGKTFDSLNPATAQAWAQLPDADEGAGEHDGFVIITADSAGGMLDIHDRRPVVLTPELAREWLDPATPRSRAEQMALFQGEPAGVFEWFRVDSAVGNPRHDGPHVIEAIGD